MWATGKTALAQDWQGQRVKIRVREGIVKGNECWKLWQLEERQKYSGRGEFPSMLKTKFSFKLPCHNNN